MVTVSIASTAAISTRSRNAVVWASSQDLNACFERPSTTARRRDGPVLVLVGVRSMMTVTYIVAVSGVPPDVLIDPDRGDTIKPVCAVDQLGADGQERIRGGVPCHAEGGADPGDRHPHRPRST